MATYTPNLNLGKPEPTDPFGNFRQLFNDNMDILDNGGGGGGGVGLILDAQIYTDTEKVIGVWRDRKPLYQIVLTITQNTALVANSWVKTEFSKGSMETLVRVDAVIDSSGVVVEALSGGFVDGMLALNSARNVGLNVADGARLIVQYTKTTDIAGSGGFEAYGFSPVIYSNVERVVGVWRDNKPLYQKTVYITALPSAVGSPTAYAHNIADIDLICDFEGTIHYANGNASKFDRLAMLTNGTAGIDAVSSMVVYLSKTDINITVGANSSTASADFTIRYTKTTDVAGSGDYNTYGVPTVHYSTSERVVGTWKNGKPLYECDFEFGSNLTCGSNSWTNTPISNSNIESVVSAVAYDSLGTVYQFIAANRNAGSYVQFLQTRNTVINISGATLRYTKVVD